MTSSPVSSLTRLLQKQSDEKKKRSSLKFQTDAADASTNADDSDDSELTNAVSIEGVEVVIPEEPDSSSHSSILNQRSPININVNSVRSTSTSSFASMHSVSNATAPPIRAPLSASLRRQPSAAGSINGSSSGSYHYSFPYSAPGAENHSQSLPRHHGLPSNVSAIDSTTITSPKVSSTGAIEPRFIVSRQKVAAAHAASSLSRRSSAVSLSGNHSSYQPSSSYSRDTPPSPSSLSSGDSMLRGSRHSSMADLRRFFRKSSGSSPKTPAMSPVFSAASGSLSRDRSGSFGGSASSYSNNVSAYTTPQNLPFSKRYGKFGENLGAGAGGSVKLIKRLSDNKVFAVKEFRKRSSTETRREYAKKITSEYCIGSTLRHANIIETIEIAYENDRILQVMEYCEYDLFAIVMSNKMSQPEIDCCFKQIVCGIQYLHHMGLAHRDLKLDNCVINEQGIVKIIDFGSSVVFSYPFSKTLIESSGVVGSDPYLSPETLVFPKYDPRPVDVWSIAIIYCCMVLKKFPWKVPKLSDNNFKLFCSGRNCDSLSSLLTRVPPQQTIQETPIIKPNGFSNLTKALAKPLNEIEKESTEETQQKNDAEEEPVVEPPVPSYEEATATSSATSPSTTAAPATAAPATTKKEEDGESHTSQLVGEARLTKALPAHVRPVISRMVELAPAMRGTIDDVMNDSWVQSIETCFVEEEVDGSGISKFIVHKAKNHSHTKVDQSEAHIAGLEKKKQQKK